MKRGWILPCIQYIWLLDQVNVSSLHIVGNGTNYFLFIVWQCILIRLINSHIFDCLNKFLLHHVFLGNGANYTMFIVSGAVGAFVLIIIMTGIFIYLIKTKANKAQQVTQSPTPYGPNMQGNHKPQSLYRPSMQGNKLYEFVGPPSPLIQNAR